MRIVQKLPLMPDYEGLG